MGWFVYVPRGRISCDRRSSIGGLCFNPLLLPEGERAVFGYRGSVPIPRIVPRAGLVVEQVPDEVGMIGTASAESIRVGAQHKPSALALEHEVVRVPDAELSVRQLSHLVTFEVLLDQLYNSLPP